jgi:hypothetical protein
MIVRCFTYTQQMHAASASKCPHLVLQLPSWTAVADAQCMYVRGTAASSQHTWYRMVNRASGAVADLDTAPATPPAASSLPVSSACCHPSAAALRLGCDAAGCPEAPAAATPPAAAPRAPSVPALELSNGCAMPPSMAPLCRPRLLGWADSACTPFMPAALLTAFRRLWAAMPDVSTQGATRQGIPT